MPAQLNRYGDPIERATNSAANVVLGSGGIPRPSPVQTLDTPGGIPRPSPVESSGSFLPDWLNLGNTTAALNANPSTKSDLEAMLRSSGDSRSAAQWLLEDLQQGDDNSFFRGIVESAANPRVDVISTPTGVTVPVSVLDPGSPDSANDASLFSQILEFLALRPPTENNTNVSPVTNTTTNLSLTDNSQTFIGASEEFVSNLFDRFANLLSVPQGGNSVISPANPPEGYAPNPDQSTQRSGSQTVATVMGLPISGGSGPLGIPWKTVIAGAVLSTVLFILYRKYFK